MNWGRIFGKQMVRDDIRAGSIYRRIRADNTVETATVIAIREDTFGIPHVRYRIRIGRSDKHILEEGPRVLSLSCFADYYREPSLERLAS